MTDTQKLEKKNFSESLTELEKIVSDIEGSDLPLEKSMELFEKGVKLSRELNERLTKAKAKVELLTKIDPAGNPETRPFEEA